MGATQTTPAAALERPMLGKTFPSFRAKCTITETTPDGEIDWHQFIEGSWAILFSHPAAFTPICTTELGAVAGLKAELEKRGVKACGFSCDSVENDAGWITDIETYSGNQITFPIIADQERDLAVALGMLDESDKNAVGLAMPVRAVFIIGPDKKLKLMILYPATTGRNMDELLRVLDSLMLTAEFAVATPANWKAGEDCFLTPKAAPENFSKGVNIVPVPSGKSYLKQTPDPTA